MYAHVICSPALEFPSGPLAIGDEPVSNIAQLEFATGSLRLLSATDCVKDRLANYYHWKDRQCLDQAIMVATEAEVDMEVWRDGHATKAWRRNSSGSSLYLIGRHETRGIKRQQRRPIWLAGCFAC